MRTAFRFGCVVARVDGTNVDPLLFKSLRFFATCGVFVDSRVPVRVTTFPRLTVAALGPLPPRMPPLSIEFGRGNGGLRVNREGMREHGFIEDFDF